MEMELNCQVQFFSETQSPDLLKNFFQILTTVESESLTGTRLSMLNEYFNPVLRHWSSLCARQCEPMWCCDPEHTASV